MSQKVFALSYAVFVIPIAFGLVIVAALAIHQQFYGFSFALAFIAFAMAFSGVVAVRAASRFKVTTLSSWIGMRYRKALLARDFKHARRWNKLARRNASGKTYAPSIVPAAVFFFLGMVIVVPSVFAITFY